MNILVVVAHMDDETFGMYGTLEKYKEHNIKVVSLCKGRRDQDIDSRRNTFMENLENLNVIAEIYDFYDLELYKEQPRTINDIIKNEIEKHKADIVYCTANDLHVEHGIINRATKVAIRNTNVKELYEIYIPGSSDISNFNSKVIVNIDIASKLQACSKYKTETNENLLKHIKAASEFIGYENYTEPSELFNLVYKINA